MSQVTYTPPFFALFFLALNPQFIRYGDSVRPHGLGLILIVCYILSHWKFLRNGTRIECIKASTFAVLAAQCLFQALPIVIGVSAAATASATRKKSWTQALWNTVPAIVSGASILFYLPKIRLYQGGGKDESSLADTFSGFVVVLQDRAHWLLPVFLFMVIGGLFAAFKLWRTSTEAEKDLAFFWVLSFVLGSSASFLFLYVVKQSHYPWHYLMLLTASTLILDPVFSYAVKKLKAVIVWMTAFLLLTSLLVPATIQNVKVRSTNADLVTLQLQNWMDRKDFVVVFPWYFGVSLQRHLPKNLHWSTLPYVEDLRTHRDDLALRAFKESWRIQRVLNQIQKELQGSRRVWLIGARPIADPERRLTWYEVGNQEFYSFLGPLQIRQRQTMLQLEISPYENLQIYEISLPGPSGVAENTKR